ncbi:MAG: Eco57I restriction-modification methylase domain-containing protein [Reichenbachiella sp.]|uniref:Eco57I restriction-modification methylase domain-containing protein n=1 Tax=Reichenbachiella sp. TaxID=2184521 RepID=UPI00326678CC
MNGIELKSILQQGYQRKNWINTLQFIAEGKDLLTVFLEPKTIELRNKKAKEVVRFLYQIGTLQTGDGDVLPVFEVELQDKIQIEYNKVGVNQLIEEFILKDARKGAIATFFYSNTELTEWRFSFISKSTGSEFFDEVDNVETNPKKYTYIFGTPEAHRTAIDRLIALKSSNLKLDDFFEAFNVEPVSNSFFKEYKKFYVDFVRSISGEEIHKKEWVQTDKPSPFYQSIFNEDPKEVRNFVKRLLGRLVFLYFLQKKRWLGASNSNYEDGDINFLQNMFQNAKNDQNSFYGKWLSQLFFNALNMPDRNNDQFILPSNDKVWIPFLNGGLFEEHQEPEDHRKITFSSYLFEDLFTFFNSYNFTIYENSPEDHTVAVDPEMLGHIFENLLEENSATGAFYTPKEIVQYMTQESLIEYLQTHLPKKNRTDIEQLIKSQSRGKFTRDDLKIVFEKIDTVKICDPAIGSGAFPMGLLQEIFFLKAFINYEEGFGVDSPAIIKQNIIQNCIYGVDLEPGAVDIARLRFWLSLVVDEPKPKPLPNLDYKIMQGDSLREKFDGIELKNIASEAVLDVENGQTDIWGNLLDGQLRATYGKSDNAKKLQGLTNQYFTATTDQKPKLRGEINRLIHESIEYNIELRESQLERFILEVEGQKTRNTRIEKQLKQWKEKLHGLNESRKKLHEIQNGQEHPYFLWHLFFKDVFDQGGFDIVIGNPPYIQLQSMGKYSEQIAEEGYDTFTRTGDIYSLFYEKGFNLLNSNGILTYITSNKWMRAGYGKTTRKYFLDKVSLLQLIDFGDARLFENATTYTNILLGKKTQREGRVQVWDLSSRFKKDASLYQNLELNSNYVSDFSENSFILTKEHDLKVKKKIEEVGTILKDWDIQIYRGLLTGFNDAFIVDAATKERLINEDKRNEEILKPIFRGRDIKKYKADVSDLWMAFIPWHFPLHKENITGVSKIAEEKFRKDYSSMYNHLLKYESQLKARNKSETGITYEWYALQRCAATYYEEFEKPKIVWAEIVYDAAFYYDDNGMFPEATGFLMTGENLKYLLALLNSKPVTYFFKKFYAGGDLRGGTFRYKKAFMENLPLPKVTEDLQQPFEVLADYILFLNKLGEKKPINEHVPNKHIAQVFEEVIDAMVMELYFKEEFERESLSFIKYASRDFVEIIDSDDPKDKQEIIHFGYQKLRDDNNEIRNNLKLMDLRLKDLVIPIKAV